MIKLVSSAGDPTFRSTNEMPHLIERHWPGDPNAMGGRRDRRGFRYWAYVPDLVAESEPTLGTAVVDELHRASEALGAPQAGAGFPPLDALSRQLLRAESIGSSWIEGLTVSQRRVVQALYVPGAANETARAVAGNVEAMEAALTYADGVTPIDSTGIDAVHRQLLAGTRDARIAGVVRTRQNWIGGDAASPRHAEFVPPPEDQVPLLMADLCAFMNRTDLPPILQAAIAHAQFETIHPYPDGSGRVGRALIHLVLRRRGAAPRFVPPVSLVLATNAARYVRGLTSFREGNLGDWLTLFARTVVAAAVRSEQLARDLADLQSAWRLAAGGPRRDSAAEKLIQMLPARPIVDAKSARAITGASDEATRKALNLLEAAGVLAPVEPARRHGRWWEAPDVLGLLDDFEWDMATPTLPDAPRLPAPRPGR